MGYYDGMGLDTDHGSSYEVASVLNLPVILVVPCRGAALSLAASVRGMLAFRKESNIRGILLNRVSGNALSPAEADAGVGAETGQDMTYRLWDICRRMRRFVLRAGISG